MQRNQSPYERTTHIGLQVPKDVVEQVESDYELLIKKSSESLWRRLHKEYPEMPLADKTEVHRIASRYSNSARNPALKRLELIVYRYCWNTYTLYKHKKSLNKKEMSKVYKQLADTIASWRGDVQRVESHEHKTKGGDAYYPTF